MKSFTNVVKRTKEWSWSYSKLKNYRTCPFRYKRIDLDKAYNIDADAEHNPDLVWGKRVHKGFEDRIGKGIPFPADLAMFEGAAQRLLQAPGKIMVEQQLAIDKQFQPCGWFADQTWFRAVADYLCVNGRVAIAVDYKSGKILENVEQLALMADVVFAHYPEVEAVRTEFWWLKDDAVSREDIYRKNRRALWQGILPEVMSMQKAQESGLFPKKSSGLCKKHCPVTECEHNGNFKKPR